MSDEQMMAWADDCLSLPADYVYRAGALWDVAQGAKASITENARLRAEVEQYRRVAQEGQRLTAPELSQDPAFAAFLLGRLETRIAELEAGLRELEMGCKLCDGEYTCPHCVIIERLTPEKST